MKEVLFVTGAANGIGRAFVEASRSRYRVVAADIDSERLIKNHGAKTDEFLPLPLDVTQTKSWEQAFDQAIHTFGRIDRVLNIAGVIKPAFIVDGDESQIDYHLSVNAKGVMLGTTLAMRFMESGGHIINIASLAGVAPISGISYYSASKFAVRGFSLAAGLELRSKGIDVTVICPDLVKTAMYDIQLEYPAETTLTFSGPTKVLTVEDINRVIFRAIDRRPAEITVPTHRGWLAKFGSMFPSLSIGLHSQLVRKGARRLAELRRSR